MGTSGDSLIEVLKGEATFAKSELQRYKRRCEVLELNLRAWQRALEWYAAPANWQEQVDDRGRETLRWRWADDDGQMARHALDCWKENGYARNKNQADTHTALQEGTGEAKEAV